MLDSKKTFKVKVRLRGTVFKILFTSAVIWIWRILHGNEIVQYLQNFKRHKFDQGHSRKLLESSTNYIQIENTKTTIYFLKRVKFCPIFDIQIDITLLYFGKSCKSTLFRNPTELKTRQHSY